MPKYIKPPDQCIFVRHDFKKHCLVPAKKVTQDVYDQGCSVYLMSIDVYERFYGPLPKRKDIHADKRHSSHRRKAATRPSGAV